MNIKPAIPSPEVPAARERLTIDVTPDVLRLLDYVAGSTGMSRNAAALMILANGLVGFVESAQALKKAAQTVAQVKK